MSALMNWSKLLKTLHVFINCILSLEIKCHSFTFTINYSVQKLMETERVQRGCIDVGVFASSFTRCPLPEMRLWSMCAWVDDSETLGDLFGTFGRDHRLLCPIMDWDVKIVSIYSTENCQIGQSRLLLRLKSR